MAESILMPRQGNTVESCLILSWKKAESETVAEGEIQPPRDAVGVGLVSVTYAQREDHVADLVRAELPVRPRAVPSDARNQEESEG